jgi:hypothetical protein
MLTNFEPVPAKVKSLPPPGRQPEQPGNRHIRRIDRADAADDPVLPVDTHSQCSEGVCGHARRRQFDLAQEPEADVERSIIRVCRCQVCQQH